MHSVLNDLKELKEKHKLTLDSLSRSLNMQASTIARWLRTGKINPFYAHYLQGKVEGLRKELCRGNETGQS
jgi:transcriptional regulator with XRE-family HTH domain